MATSTINSRRTLSPTKSERSALLQRVVESPGFRRANRLRDFLLYVGNEALNDVEEINEQQVGVAVFGRQPGYDTAQDNIVRVNAMEVRKRIDLYFANDGQEESLICEIPRGTYALLFRIREVDSPVVPSRSLAPVAESLPVQSLPSSNELPTARLMQLPAWILLSIGLFLLAIIAALASWAISETYRNRRMDANLHEWTTEPALRAFWGNFFGKDQPVDIVLADTSYTLAQEVTHQPLSLADYLNYQYRNVRSHNNLSADARKQEAADLALVFGHSNGSIGDFRVARRIAELEFGGAATRLVYARDYSGHALRRSNAILLGSSRSNPWAELFESQMAYHFVPAQGSSDAYVKIDNPTGAEPPKYTWPSDPNAQVGYCILSLLPNLTDTGSTLIIAGTTSLATEAGGDFITSEEGLRTLLARFHRTTFPRFQVLLRVTRSSGTPIGSEIVSYRIASQS